VKYIERAFDIIYVAVSSKFKILLLPLLYFWTDAYYYEWTLASTASFRLFRSDAPSIGLNIFIVSDVTSSVIRHQCVSHGKMMSSSPSVSQLISSKVFVLATLIAITFTVTTAGKMRTNVIFFSFQSCGKFREQRLSVLHSKHNLSGASFIRGAVSGN
jgi:hypothetical protein